MSAPFSIANPGAKTWPRFALAALLAVAGFGAGGWLAIQRRAEGILAAYPATGATIAPRLPVGTDAHFQNDEEAGSAVFSACREKDGMRRNYDLYEAIQRLDASQFAAITKRVAKLSRDEQQELMEPLMARWVELDRDAATAWARPLFERADGSQYGLKEIVRNAWARAAPEEALAEALKRPNSAASSALVYAATAALAGDNPAAQIDRLAALPTGKLRDQALQTCLSEWGKKDPAAAYAQIGRLGPGQGFESARGEVLKAWAGKDAPAALAQLRALVPGLSVGISGSALVNRVISAAAGKDPAAALEWARSLPESMQTQAMASALVAWAPGDPVAALEWARAHGLPLDATGWSADGLATNVEGGQAVLESAMTIDGDTAIEWLRKLPAGEERSRFLARAIRQNPSESSRALLGELLPADQVQAAQWLAWRVSSEDPAQALQWAQTLPSGLAREEAISGVISSRVGRFPKDIDALVAKFAPGSDHDAAYGGYAVSLIWRDPEKGIQMAQKITDPADREQTLRAVVGGWLSRDTSAAQAWLDATPELTPEAKAVLLREHRER